MSHAIYTAMSGAVAQERNLETIADNLANVNTAGFKGSRLSFRSLLAEQPGMEGQESPHIQVEISHNQNDFTQGSVIKTGNKLDVALKGAGFFSVLTSDGERLTRQGSFLHAGDGYLRTQSGDAVLGEAGPIQAPPDRPMVINHDGSVFCDNVYLGILKRSHASDPNSITREGNATWRADDLGALTPVLTPLETGALEKSNVNPVTAMTQLINTQRSYEMYTRAIETVRGLEQKTSQQLG